MAISNFGVPKQHSKGIGENNFQIFKINFLAKKFKIEIEFQVLRCRFLIFRKPKLSKFEIPKFGRVGVCIFIQFRHKIFIF